MDIVLIENGFLTLVAAVHGRQLNFYRRFKPMLKPQSTRYALFNKLLESNPSHLISLRRSYNIHFEYFCKMKNDIQTLDADGSHYKYKMYFNIQLNSCYPNSYNSNNHVIRTNFPVPSNFPIMYGNSYNSNNHVIRTNFSAL